MTSKIIPGQYITPTHKLGANHEVETYISGRGTCVSDIRVENTNVPIIVGTILGNLVITEVASDEDKKNGKSFMVSVLPRTGSYVRHQQGSAASVQDLSQSAANLPKEGDIVLVRITRATSKQAYCEILTVEGAGNVLADSGVGTNGEVAHNSLGFGGGSQSLSNHSTIASSQTSQLNAVANDLGENFKGLIRSQDVRLLERDKVNLIECFRPGDIVRAQILSLGDGSNYYLSTARNDLGVIIAKSEGGAGDVMLPMDWQHMICPTSGIVEKRKCAKPF